MTPLSKLKTQIQALYNEVSQNTELHKKHRLITYYITSTFLFIWSSVCVVHLSLLFGFYVLNHIYIYFFLKEWITKCKSPSKEQKKDQEQRPTGELEEDNTDEIIASTTSFYSVRNFLFIRTEIYFDRQHNFVPCLCPQSYIYIYISLTDMKTFFRV